MVIHIKNGQYGPYIQIIKNNKKVNKSLSKNIKIESITKDKVIEYIQEIWPDFPTEEDYLWNGEEY